MRPITVEERFSNKRIDKYLMEVFPNIPFGAIQKALRKKDIKVNGFRIKQDYIVKSGDKLEIFITDNILDGVKPDSHKPGKSYKIIYEDKNILIVNKSQGLPVHPDRGQASNTLIDLVRTYLKDKNNSAGSTSFPPSLCHRLDRNTGGLVIIAKNQESLEVIRDKMETKEIKKYYQCLVKGKMDKQQAELKAYLFKDEKNSKVYISENKTTGMVGIITKYRVLEYKQDLDVSLLEIELVTGRTHQIRAHLAYTGHPVIGDGKYGTNAVNRPLGLKYQALWAYKLKFDFDNGGILNYLKGREFEIKPEIPIS